MSSVPNVPLCKIKTNQFSYTKIPSLNINRQVCRSGFSFSCSMQYDLAVTYFPLIHSGSSWTEVFLNYDNILSVNKDHKIVCTMLKIFYLSIY